jgi:hypothetical protein
MVEWRRLSSWPPLWGILTSGHRKHPETALIRPEARVRASTGRARRPCAGTSLTSERIGPWHHRRRAHHGTALLAAEAATVETGHASHSSSIHSCHPWHPCRAAAVHP